MSSVSVKSASKKMKGTKIAVPESAVPILVYCPEGQKKLRSGIFVGGPMWNNGASYHPVIELQRRDLQMYLDFGMRDTFLQMYGGDGGGESDLLNVLMRMAEAIKRGRHEKAQSILEGLHKKWGVASVDEVGINARSVSVADRVGWLFTTRIAKSAPVIWRPDNTNQLAFGLLCDNVAEALFLLALREIGVGRIGECQGCGALLIADRSSKKFCSAKCRSRTFMRNRARAG